METRKMDVLFITVTIIFFGLLLMADDVQAAYRPDTRTCEPITIPMCRSIEYNFTSMPNDFHHDTQEEAGMEVHQFWPLVKVNCSEDLVMLLCSVYVPICMTNYPKPVPVCRSVCERAKYGCGPLMEQYGFEWPEKLNCANFPVFGQDTICMDKLNGSGVPPKQTPVPKISVEVSKCSCAKDLAPKTTEGSRLATCHSPFVTMEERDLGEYWIGFWAVLCCLCTVLTLVTYLIDTQRFKYPERPIVLIAFCYLMVSLGFIIRLFYGHEALACDGDVSRKSVTSPAPCVVVFLLLYYFGMASCIWWVILSLTWYLSAGLRWSTEAISGYATRFHFVAWSIPLFQSIAVLGMPAVDGDPVAGVCYVGHHNVNYLKGFLVAPLAIYLVIGLLFLLAGFVSLVKIRKAIKLQHGSDREKGQKFTRLMKRIGLFSLCTFLPNVTLLGCYSYEMYFREQWERSLSCECKKDTPAPIFAIFMVKYLCMLVVGITSGVWLISGKTVDSWKRFCCRDCGQSNSTKSSEFTLVTSPQSMNRFYKSQNPIAHV